MTVLEAFPELATWDLEIVGFDVDEAALERARAGVYSKLEIQRGVPSWKVSHFFAQEGDQYRARPSLRARVRFERMNLIEHWPLSRPVDVLFLRNVLIYFTADTRARVLKRAARHLAPDGFLFAGSSERVDDGGLFEVATDVEAPCYRLRGVERPGRIAPTTRDS